MKASLIINTFNRARALRNCLRSLEFLAGDFEIVVVNGPSNDNTIEVCRNSNLRPHIVECNEKNLSLSRNIGIKAAKGDVVAFLDDDAVAHPLWLTNLLRCYRNERIAAVGGFTIDNTGNSFQAKTTLCDRFGDAYHTAIVDFDSFCIPNSPLFPSLLGTNCSFRRDVLFDIGGFDEAYQYFLDETDVCLRIVDAGLSVHYCPEALIYHQYAPSYLRNENRVPKSLHVQARSKAYFAYRHAIRHHKETEIYLRIHTYQSQLHESNAWLHQNGHISRSTQLLLNEELATGLSEGRTLANFPPVLGLLRDSPAPAIRGSSPIASAKKSMKLSNKKDQLLIGLFSQGYPPGDTNGIARWTRHLAEGLTGCNHEAHVFTRSDSSPRTEFVDGQWIHHVTPSRSAASTWITNSLDIPSTCTNWSASAYEEALSFAKKGFDVISCPIWDVEGLVPLLVNGDRILTSLHTTYKLALPYKPDWHRPIYYHNHVSKIIAAEHFIFENAPYFLANSQSIIREINSAYAVDITSRSFIVPHGMAPGDRFTDSGDSPYGNPANILFVGRHETRKGFDVALNVAEAVCRKDCSVRFRFVGQETADSLAMSALKSFRERAEPTVRNRVEIDGYLTQADLENAYFASDIVLIPSKYESFGLVAIEAMRHGKPIVCSNCGGLAEVVLDGVNGILCDPDNPTAFSDAILLLVNDRDLYLRMCGAAKDRFHQEYTLDKMIERTVRVYKTIRDM